MNRTRFITFFNTFVLDLLKSINYLLFIKNKKMNQKIKQEPRSFRFKKFARKSYSAFSSLGKSISIGVIVGTTLAMMSGTVTAQNGEKPVRQLEKELDEVYVTAAVEEMPLEEATKSVSVITRKEIQQAPVESINDLLQYVASVDVTQRGKHGVQTDVSIRGGSFDQIAILLNGINLSNAQTGHLSLNLPINISDIEQIEIISGSSSLIYGTAAFTGAINIITKKNVAEKIFAKAEAGMHEFKNLETRGSFALGKTINSVSVGYKSTDGYIDNSDFSIYNAAISSRYRINNENILDLQLGYNDRKFGANTFYSAKFPNQYEETNTYLASLQGSFGSKFKIKPKAFWERNHDTYSLIKNSTQGQNHHRNDTYGAGLIVSYPWLLGSSSFTGNIRRDEIMSSNIGELMAKPHRIYTKYANRLDANFGLQHIVKVKDLIVDLGFLMAYNSTEKGKMRFLPSLGANYSFFNGFSIKSSYGKSYRVPTFTDLYYTSEVHSGNQGLKTETMQSWDATLSYTKSFFNVYATGFMSWGRNMIDWVKDDHDNSKWKSWNHSKLDTKGLELGAQLNINKLTNALGENSYLKVDYVQMTQKQDAGGLISRYSLNYLKSKVTAQFHHTIYKSLSATWYFRYQNRAGSYIDYSNSTKGEEKPYPSYATVDLKLNYKISDINIYADISNLTNRKYFDLGSVPQPKLWFIGGVTYTLR